MNHNGVVFVLNPTGHCAMPSRRFPNAPTSSGPGRSPFLRGGSRGR